MIKFAQSSVKDTESLDVYFVDGNFESLPLKLKEALHYKPKAKVCEAFPVVGIKLSSVTTRDEVEALADELYNKVSESVFTKLNFFVKSDDKKALSFVQEFYLLLEACKGYHTGEKAKKCSLSEVILVGDKDLEGSFKSLHSAAEGVLYARAFTSKPPNQLVPSAYAEKLKELESLGVQVEIFNEKDLEVIGMHALLAIGKGSVNPPRVVVLKWNGCNSVEPPIALVGKGVSFDSGGICLKPFQQMLDMKWDKAGAGVVIGILKSLAIMKASVNVVGVIGLIENMPDGAAAKPGDVVTTISKETVEIVNTDAEGRLVLAECLWYAENRFNPEIIIDFGTLTLETICSLGGRYAALYTENRALAKSLKKAGEESGDLLWELPMGPYFAKQIESQVADMKNVGVDFCGENGAAAEFLKRFIKPKTKWAHIDIAGVSWTLEGCAKKVTGFGVRLILEWLKERS